MAEGGFNLRQLADIYANTWREGSEEAGLPAAFSNIGVSAIQSFVIFVERLQSEQK